MPARLLAALAAAALTVLLVLRRRALVVLAAAVLAVAAAGPAHAADVASPSSGVGVAFTLDPAAVVQLLVAFVLPVLVGLITTRVTAAAAKAWLLAGATLLTSLLVELGRVLAAGGVYDAGAALLLALPAFVVSVASHYGLWKPTGVSAAAQDVGARHRA